MCTDNDLSNNYPNTDQFDFSSCAPKAGSENVKYNETSPGVF